VKVAGVPVCAAIGICTTIADTTVITAILCES
jgi:hypothetical protein